MAQIREPMIAKALEFLAQEVIQAQTDTQKKVAFLMGKGLTKEECDEALRRAEQVKQFSVGGQAQGSQGSTQQDVQYRQVPYQPTQQQQQQPHVPPTVQPN